MIVPDASAVALLVADPGADPRVTTARQVLVADPAWAVPEHWRTEVLSAVRGLWLGHKLDDDLAHRAVAALAQMVVQVTPTLLLLDRMWQLRSAMSTYDAGYVAAAEAHACTLVTADARLARSGAARCPVHVIV
ncbi:MAG: type II toxin-antitoxin system VapC family toxin [Micrococcales bacterium]|nr:type II toxin-antitoxin system VapC family toxin [Micrococcales bacterium]